MDFQSRSVVRETRHQKTKSQFVEKRFMNYYILDMGDCASGIMRGHGEIRLQPNTDVITDIHLIFKMCLRIIQQSSP